MDSNPIHHPSPAKKNEMLVFRLRSLLMICLADWWTWTPSATPLQPIKWNAQLKWNGLIFGFLDYVQLLMINQAGQWTRTPSASPLHVQPIKMTHATPLQPIKWNASFWITSDDQLLMIQPKKWLVHLLWMDSMDLNPIHHPSPANKMKCSFLDYVQLLMISRAGQWNRTPSTSPLQPKKMKCYFLYYVQLLMISQACQWTWTPSTTLLQPKNEILIFVLRSTSDVG